MQAEKPAALREGTNLAADRLAWVFSIHYRGERRGTRRRNQTDLPSLRPSASSAVSLMSPKPHGLTFLELRDPVDDLVVMLLGMVARKAVLHEKSILAAIFVETTQNAHGSEALGSEEKLSG